MNVVQLPTSDARDARDARATGDGLDARRAPSMRANIAPTIPAGTPAASDMIPLDIPQRSWYTTPEREWLYDYAAPVEAPTDSDGAPTTRTARRGLFTPVMPFPRVQAIYRAPRGNRKPSEDIFYEIAVLTPDGLDTHTVTGAQLDDGSAWAWWGLRITRRRDRDDYADLVKTQATLFAIPLVEARTVTGWYHDRASDAIDYLLPDGRRLLQPDAPPLPIVGYSMAPHHARAWAEHMPTLPTTPPTRDALDALINWCQYVSPAGHVLITVGAALRSFADEVAPSCTTLYGYGRAGALKTGVALWARGVLGPSPYRSEADFLFGADQSTANGVEADLTHLHHMPLVADNFRHKPTDTPADMRVTTSQFDRAVIAAESRREMRSRLNRDGSKRQGGVVETLPLANGEIAPDVLESTVRRTLLLRYVKGVSVLADVWRVEADQRQPTLTALGHSVLRWLASQYAVSRADLVARVEAVEGAYYLRLLDAAGIDRQASEDFQSSVCANWARVLTGWWLADQTMGAAGDGLDAGDALDSLDGAYVARVWPAVVAMMNSQLDSMIGATPGDDGLAPFGRLVARLADRIAAGLRVNGQYWVIASTAGDAPHGLDAGDGLDALDVAPFTWGWPMDDTHAPVARVGYVGERGVLYLTTPLLDELRRMALTVDDCAHLRTEAELWRAAKREGWIVQEDSDAHRATRFRVGGRLLRGWAIPAAWWLDGRTDGAPGAPAPSTPPTSLTLASATPAPVPRDALDAGDGLDALNSEADGYAAPFAAHYLDTHTLPTLPCRKCHRVAWGWTADGQAPVCRHCHPSPPPPAPATASTTHPSTAPRPTPATPAATQAALPTPVEAPTSRGHVEAVASVASVEAVEAVAPVASVEGTPGASPAITHTTQRQPGHQGHNERIGVADRDGLWLPADAALTSVVCVAWGADRDENAMPRTIAAALALARRYHLAQLWLHQSACEIIGLPLDALRNADEKPLAIQEGQPHPFTDARDGWDIQPNGLAPWIHCYQPGDYGAIDLVLTPHEAGNWYHASDGATLLRALRYYRGALGLVYRRSPAATSTRLLRDLHRGPHALRIEAPASLPAPALAPTTEFDMAWLRPLDAQEHQRAYIHGYDRRSMYLGACSALRLGWGEAEYVEAGADGALSLDVFTPQLPGYWLVGVTWPATSLVGRGLLPDPTAPSFGPAPAATRWLTTDTVALARDYGAHITLHSAYRWQTYHRPLDPWYTRLRDALRALDGATGDTTAYPDVEARALARKAVKGCYQQQSGWFAAAFHRRAVAAGAEPNALYRPDWRHMIMARARANFWRKLAGLVEAGARPIGIATDCVYFASDTTDPLDAAPDGITFGPTLRDYTVKLAAAPLSLTLATFDRLASEPRWVGALRRFVEIITPVEAVEAAATEDEE